MGAAEKLDPTASVLTFFATEMRRVRTEARMQQADLAKRAFVTPSLLSKIEAAQRVPSEDLAVCLDETFDTGKHFRRLWPLVTKYAYPAWFRPFVELEAQARDIHTYEPMVITGLLQTESYARAVLATGRPDNLEELLAARMERQRILTRETPPRQWLVLDERALRRNFGGRKVMCDQLEHLIDIARTTTNVIQVVPFTADPHPDAGRFSTLSFAEGPDLLYEEGFAQGQLVADPRVVREAARVYDLIRAVALSPDASISLIDSTLKELDP